VSRRSDVLELAVLGLLQESPLHGYELRKRLNSRLGVFRALSYGTLYPALRALLTRGWIREIDTSDDTTRGIPGGISRGISGETKSTGGDVAAAGLGLAGTRGRIVYEITADGKEHFQTLVSSPGPDAWEDGTFDVHLAFFARTDAATRLRILENRRLRVSERMESARLARLRSREWLDEYTLALQQHGLDAAEREVRWLTELIDTERASNMTHLDDPDRAPPSGASPSEPPPSEP
jgi:DNA-binding PadR family transcriptional regulator